MARRRESDSRIVLTKEQLADFRKKVEQMTESELVMHYQATHNACRYTGIRVPSAEMIQELVQLWKRLWKMRGGGRARSAADIRNV